MTDDEPTPAADRRTARKAVRDELARRRQYGIRRRHQAKAEHWRENGLPDNLADLQRRLGARQVPSNLRTGTQPAAHNEQEINPS